MSDELCDDCPPIDYPTDKTRCTPCPRRKPGIEIISQHSNQIGGVKVTFTVGRLGKRS